MSDDLAKPTDHRRQKRPPEASQVETIQYGGPGDTDGGEPASSHSLPKEFGRYRIVRQLGAGAMGAVYLAHDTKLDRRVALKTPSFGENPPPDMIERFYREARLAATLRHSNICPVYDVGEMGGVHFISMAYIDGRPLADFIRPNELVPPATVALVVRKLALALAEAHKHGVIHRDLKPANIMVDRNREPIVMDFGLARRAEAGDQSLQTQTGMILGTPAYMAPEQLESDPDLLGPHTDQYSLGIILYELLTSTRPFQGSVAAVLGQIMTQTPRAPREIRPDLDPELEAICQRMISKRGDERYGSMKDVARALADYLKSGSASSSQQRKTTSARPAAGLRPSDFPRPQQAAAAFAEPEPPSSIQVRPPTPQSLDELLAIRSSGLGVEAESLRWLKDGPSRPRSVFAQPAVWLFAIGAMAVVLAFVAVTSSQLSSEPDVAGAADDAAVELASVTRSQSTRPEPAAEPSTPDPPAAPTPATTVADDWIDVIPLIDPAQDRLDFHKTGRNDWRIENGELKFFADGRPGKLLFPLVLEGKSLEWEIDFTRTRGETGFSTDVPADGGVVPILFDSARGEFQNRFKMAVDAALSGPCDIQTGKRMSVKVRVERRGGDDRIEIFVNGASEGVWTGDRQTILEELAWENFPTDRHNGLYVHPDSDYTFHRIRLRMLEGEARPIDDATARANGWTRASNGRDLSGWRMTGQGSWKVDGGAVVGSSGVGMLIYEKTLRNFGVAMDVFAESRSNGGVFLHLPPDFNHNEQGYEVQVAGSEGDPGNNYTGGIYEGGQIVRRVNPPVARDARWVPLWVVVEGTKIKVWVDGRAVTEFHGRPERMPGGFLALQSKASGPVGYRNIRVVRLPDTPTAQSTPSATDQPQLVRLDELDVDGRAFYPWVSQDGLRVYWEAAAPSGDANAPNWIWTASRASPTSRFEHRSPIWEGRQPTLTPDELQMVYVTPGQKLLRKVSRASKAEEFGSRRSLPQLRTHHANGPWIRQNGLVLFFTETVDRETRYLMAKRGDTSQRWRRAVPVPTTWDPRVGFITWLSIAPDGLSMLCTCETDHRKVLRATRLRIGEPFDNFQPLVIPGIGEIHGRCPRYVPATKELFISGLERFELGSDDDAWLGSPIAKGHIWVIRNVEPSTVFGRSDDRATSSTESNREQREEWVDLFNGRDLDGWQVLDDPGTWRVEGGVLIAEGPKPGGYLVSTREFSDFELSLDYRLQKESNSGVMLRTPRQRRDGFGGLEVALIDNASFSREQRQRRFLLNGALHGLVGPRANADRPIGQWNNLVLRALGRHLTVTLNDQLIQDVDLNTLAQANPDNAYVRRSNGHIALQRWKGNSEFRNVRIRELSSNDR